MENVDPVLSLADFVEKQNNFYLHFLDIPLGKNEFQDLYFEHKFYRKCKEKHPIRFFLLNRKLTKMLGSKGGFIPGKAYSLLYKMYKIMRPYSESDQDLWV
jgi:hypothetical protein